MKKLVYCILFLIVFCPPAAAGKTGDVEILLKEKIDKVLDLLRDKNLDKKQRNEGILEIVDPMFDFKLMAKLSLGKKHWPGLNKDEKNEYLELFVKRMKESYLEKMDLYTDEDMVYDEAKAVGKKVHMKTYLASRDNKLEMLYKFYRSGERWKVYDVEIEGVSIIQTYRSQFDGVLRDGTVADLIAKLKKPGEFSSVEVNN
ncbi:MAG: ABC transporter substrate-binding protein [Deltaproteobacteria bacterium]|nr:ABC transporter substrate-binding protein [Deltaproteobacteria bacterium]